MTWFYSTWSLHLLHSVGNMLLGVAFEWTHSSYISAQSQFNWPFSLYKNSRFWDESTWKTNPAQIIFIWLRVINYFHAEGFVLALFLRKRLWKCKDDLNQLTGLVSRIIIIPVPSKSWIIESPRTSTQKALFKTRIRLLQFVYSSLAPFIANFFWGMKAAVHRLGFISFSLSSKDALISPEY